MVGIFRLRKIRCPGKQGLKLNKVDDGKGRKNERISGRAERQLISFVEVEARC